MRTLSERLAALSARAEKTEDTIRAARDKNRRKLEDQRTQLKSSEAVLEKIGQQQASDVRTEADTKWAAAHDALQASFSGVRSRMADRRVERDLGKAEKQADRAETDAAYAIDVAMYCLYQAEYAIIDAVVSRADADELAHANRNP